MKTKRTFIQRLVLMAGLGVFLILSVVLGGGFLSSPYVQGATISGLVPVLRVSAQRLKLDREVLEQPCDGQERPVANGAATIRGPKNAGQCPLTLQCHDQAHAVVGAIAQGYGVGEGNAQFVCPPGTHHVGMTCDNMPDGKCQLSYVP